VVDDGFRLLLLIIILTKLQPCMMCIWRLITALQCPQQQDVAAAATPLTRRNGVTETKHVNSRMLLGIFHEIILTFVLEKLHNISSHLKCF